MAFDKRWVAASVLVAVLVGAVSYGLVSEGGKAQVIATSNTAKAEDYHKEKASAQGYRAPPALDASKPAQGSPKLDPGKNVTYFQTPGSNVKDIMVDGDAVWVATTSGLIFNDRKTGAFKVWNTKSGLVSNGVFHVSRLSAGKILVGTYGGGLSVLDEKTGLFSNYNVPEGLADAFVYDTVKDAKGDLWIATWSGLNKVGGGRLSDKSAWETFDVKGTQGGLPNDWVYGLANGKRGELWVATEGGMARLSNGRWDNWNHSKGLGAKYEEVAKDADYQTDPADVSTHRAAQKKEMGLSGTKGAYNPNYVVSMDVAPDGGVWAGTWGGGLSVWNGSSWKNYTVRDGLPGNLVFWVKRDSKGRMWVDGPLRGCYAHEKTSVA